MSSQEAIDHLKTRIQILHNNLENASEPEASALSVMLFSEIICHFLVER